MLPAPSAVDAVIFDAGGVLLMPDAEAGQAALATLNCETRPEDWHRAHYASNVVLDRMQTLDWQEHRRAIASEVGVPTDQLDAAAGLIEQIFARTAWVAADGAADALRVLATAGYKLAVVSNAWGMVAQWLEQHEICSVNGSGLTRVGAVIDSHIVGIEKPDPRIFRLGLDALGVEPDRSLYVGDTVKFDVLGALAAGLHPVHVDPYGFCTGPHAHVTGLAELTSWLTSDEALGNWRAGSMAFDEELADRTRAALGAASVTPAEKKMFGGLAFMVAGNMCCGIMGEDLLVRVGPEASDSALADPAARAFDMGRGASPGFILVGPRGTGTEGELGSWVERALAFVTTLPAKKK